MECVHCFLFVALCVGVLAVLSALAAQRRAKLEALDAQINSSWRQLRTTLTSTYLTEPCSRCLEAEMELIEISPNARSIHYKCTHCGKKTRSPAGTPDAGEAIELWDRYRSLVQQFNTISKDQKHEFSVLFKTVEAPLPFEQTTRTPIPEAVRTEVWRRDRGRCVQCGTNQNLQFDHIIPVSKGGATTAKNLQLLCQPCNSAKRAKI
jgi:hypothetical protein